MKTWYDYGGNLTCGTFTITLTGEDAFNARRLMLYQSIDKIRRVTEEMKAKRLKSEQTT